MTLFKYAGSPLSPLLSSLRTLTLLLNLSSFFLPFHVCTLVFACSYVWGVHACEHSCRAQKLMSEIFLSYSFHLILWGMDCPLNLKLTDPVGLALQFALGSHLPSRKPTVLVVHSSLPSPQHWGCFACIPLAMCFSWVTGFSVGCAAQPRECATLRC